MDKITLEEFKKVEIRMGKVISCDKVDGADKLLKLPPNRTGISNRFRVCYYIAAYSRTKWQESGKLKN